MDKENLIRKIKNIFSVFIYFYEPAARHCEH
jgi:hypothetical protein